MADNHLKLPTAEEIFPNLENERLIQAMVEINKEENTETQRKLIEIALQSKFFAPVDIIDANGNVLMGTGKMPMPKDGKFNFKLIKNEKGESYFPIFTDIDEFRKWSGDTSVNAIVVVFPQMANLCSKRPDAVNGFVINPLTHNIVFNQEALKHILEAASKVAAAQAQQGQQPGQRQIQLFFGEPKNVPEAVLNNITKKLEKTPEVKTAHFCMMKQEEQEYYLFVLDIDADPAKSKEIGDSVCAAAKLFLTKFPIMAAPINSPFGEGAKKVGAPFYEKK